MKLLRENLFAQFSVISFVAMAVIALVLVAVLSNSVRARAVEAVMNEAIGDASGRLLSIITPADLVTPMTGARYNWFNKFVQSSIVSERTARVKLWAKDGTVIYANDPSLVGGKFPDNENLLKALGGQNAAEIRKATAPENEQERFLGTLIEVYTPIRFAGNAEPQGAFEIYQYYQPTEQLINDMRRWVFISVGVGFLVLYGVLVSGVWRGWRTIVRQRTEHEEDEKEMARLASFVELNPDPVIEVDLAGKVTYVNEAARKRFPTISKTAKHPILKVLRTIVARPPNTDESVVNETIVGKRLYQQIVYYNVESQTLRCYSHDITEERRAETLEAEARVANLASQAKSQFLASVSHELRTPLSFIKGYATTLLRSDVPHTEEVKQEFLQIITEESDKLQELVENLLETSRIQARAFIVDKKHINIEELAKQTMVRAQTTTTSHSFLFDFEPIPSVDADPRRLEQVLHNLLDNAIKHSPNGGLISIKGKQTEDFIQISISDEGEGMPQTELNNIFEPFYRIPGSESRRVRGAGLGLTICRAIIETHGGIIWAESVPGKGSTFNFTLPVCEDSHE